MVLRVALIDLDPEHPVMTSQMLMPKHGLLSVGTKAAEDGHLVSVFVECLNGVPFDELARYDLVGASVTMPNIGRVRQVFSGLRRDNPDIVLVGGGPHCTLIPEDVVQFADFVVRDEGEETFRELLRVIENGQDPSEIPGLTFLQDGHLIHTKRRPFSKQLGIVDNLSLLDGFRARSHLSQIVALRGRYVGYAITSRGCPSPCSFCYENMIGGTGYRTYSIELFLQDVRNKAKFFGVRHFWLADSTFGVDVRYAKKVLRAIIQSDIDCSFTALCRVDIARDTELLSLMKQAGFTTLVLGMEATDDTVLDQIRKKQAVNDIESAIYTIHEAGMAVYGLFMLGFDTDTEDSPDRIVSFCCKNKVDGMNFYILTEFDSLSGQTLPWWRIAETDQAYYTGYFATTFPLRVRPSVLEERAFRALQRFYSLGRVLRSVCSKSSNVSSFQIPLYLQCRKLSRISKLHVKRLRSIEAPYYTDDGLLDTKYLRNNPVVSPFRHRRSSYSAIQNPANVSSQQSSVAQRVSLKGVSDTQ